jgi:hypothetical protein
MKFNFRSLILFDRRDHVLLKIVNSVLTAEKPLESSERRFFPYLHPRGIKEMAESRGIRIAHAAIHVLKSLEVGKFEDRLSALRCLRDEVLNVTTGPLPKNTARVLLQIMKEMIRAHGNYVRQLELAHDFRITATGKPRIVRKQLQQYHLLEMPEQWNQISFDDHVHDINTKGRKSSTHLIMDAWIKGIRRLRVIYYNYIEPRSAAELHEAAEIMGIDVRVGIEFSASFRGSFVKLIWAPRGFHDSQAFLCFLAEEQVQKLMFEGKQVSRYQQKYVLDVLVKFNEVHRLDINQEYGIFLEPLNEREFLISVGAGQASLIHLAIFIHTKMLEMMKEKVLELQKQAENATEEKLIEIRLLIEQMNGQDVDAILEKYLYPSRNPDIPDPEKVHEYLDIPPLLRLTPRELLIRLALLRSGYRVTLNLSNLRLEDVIELLYDCEGIITRLEIFNLKDYVTGKTDHISSISALQTAINDGNVVAIKRIIRQTIDCLDLSEINDKTARIEKLTTILHDIDTLKNLYAGILLKSRIGSDSTGHSPKIPGMGLCVIETLPNRSQKEVLAAKGLSRTIIPMFLPVLRRITHIPYISHSYLINLLFLIVRKIPGLHYLGYRHWEDWYVQDRDIRMTQQGNIFTLGGAQPQKGNELYLKSPNKKEQRPSISWSNLNSNLKNIIKILLGFIPAYLTFRLSYDWWVLMYMGAFIWFGITLCRNIIQSVLGGGGFRRSPLLKWNDYVSWDRISDSLFFTGWSVPLLDLLVKTILLNNFLGINTATHPVMLYSFIALANGIYLSSHNAFRGLPKTAVYGNFFRSVLSIPIAIGLNSIIGTVLYLAGVTAVDMHLQTWAAVISKASSDIMAGIIEGTADRDLNVRSRLSDYQNKLLQLFDTYAKLEVLLPQVRVLEALRSVEDKKYRSFSDARDLKKLIILHCLDLVYFWMYQPRARVAFKTILLTLSDEEHRILLQSQNLLKNEREIGQMFLDGLIGSNFSRGLSFYLDRSGEYLKTVEKMVAKIPPSEDTLSNYCVIDQDRIN